MIVVVDGSSRTVALTNAENLTALSVRLESCDAAAADAVLGAVGHVDGDHVWLDIAAIAALSPLVTDEQWRAGFDGAMAYAVGKGWTDPTGRLVRAHLT